MADRQTCGLALLGKETDAATHKFQPTLTPYEAGIVRYNLAEAAMTMKRLHKRGIEDSPSCRHCDGETVEDHVAAAPCGTTASGRIENGAHASS